MTRNMIRKLFSLEVQAGADKMKLCCKSEQIEMRAVTWDTSDKPGLLHWDNKIRNVKQQVSHGARTRASEKLLSK